MNHIKNTTVVVVKPRLNIPARKTTIIKQSLLIFCCNLGFTVTPNAHATAFKVRESDSLFAVITNKAGIAAKLAHNHLITAQNYTSQIEFDEALLAKSKFIFTAPSALLEVDNKNAQQKWEETITSLECLPSPFSDVSDSHRKEITENMLDANQLDSKNYPEIKAEVTQVLKENMTFGKKTYPMSAQLTLTIRGKKIVRKIAAAVKQEAGVLFFEGVGRFTYEEFGFSPFSAMLGAVKNGPQFCIYVNAKAEKS